MRSSIFLEVIGTAAERYKAGREAAFRRLALFAVRHAGEAYVDAFRVGLSSDRFFEEIPPSNRVFVELSDSVVELPSIAHLAVRGALADSSPDVVGAARAVLDLHPEISERMSC